MSTANLKVFSGTANPELAREIARHLKVSLGKVEIRKFADGETYVNIGELVRGKDVFIVQPTSCPQNENLMELLIMIDAAKRAVARRITAVIPYYGYSKQDRKSKHREPITAKLVANLLEKAGADAVITIDLHAEQIQGFFDISLNYLYASDVIVDYFKKKNLKDVVIVAPDVGATKRARAYAKQFDAPLAIIDKRRPRPNVAEVMNVIGDVKGMNAIIVDDEINTGGTTVNAAEAVKKAGAKDIYATCVHAVLAGPAVERLSKAPIKEVVVTDTILVPKEKRFAKLKVLSVAKLLADSIHSIHEDKSVSALLHVK
ncbi:MAG: ribose-phosphate pyrophosphokinase [Candidatus Diapherotrites archaeon]|nr:ribose-phosphate pyrophosphokinase [Candidatus Micrarchaeota archaeon]